MKVYWNYHGKKKGFPGGPSAKEPACQCRRLMRCRFDPWVGKIPQRRKCQPMPVCLPAEFHGQRSLKSCSPWAPKEWTRLKQHTIQWLQNLVIILKTPNWKKEMNFYGSVWIITVLKLNTILPLTALNKATCWETLCMLTSILCLAKTLYC